MELESLMKTEEMQKTFEAQGADPEFVGSTAFVKFMENETAKWGKVIKEGNIQAEK